MALHLFRPLVERRVVEIVPPAARRAPFAKLRVNVDLQENFSLDQSLSLFVLDTLPLLDAAAPGGRIVFFGGTLGNITDIPPAKVFWKQLSILGSTMGSPQDFADMLAFVTEKKLVPVVDEVFPLAEGEAALRRLAAGAQFGKIVLQIG